MKKDMYVYVIVITQGSHILKQTVHKVSSTEFVQMFVLLLLSGQEYLYTFLYLS